MSEKCVGCKKGVAGGVTCSVCKSSFHTSCTKNCGPLSNGAFTKCCRPSSPNSQFLSADTANAPPASIDRGIINERKQT